MTTTTTTAAATSTVTVAELKLFHTIDREMYCKLIFSLHHNPLLAIRIMTFWLWLETTRICRNFMLRLHSVSLVVLNSIALETITCIYCLDDPIFALSIIGVGIPCLRYIVTEYALSISYLVDNRVAVLQSMQKISNSVCAGAFEDLLTSQLLSQRLKYERNGSTFYSGSSSSGMGSTSSGSSTAGTDVNVTRAVVVGPRRNKNMSIKGKEKMTYYYSHDQEEEEEINTTDDHENISASIDHDVVVDEQIINERISTQHERTVFLTFSKGYPVTETQLRDFFVGEYGDIIEDIIMQEVQPGEQVLYARMLVHSSNEVERVLGRQNRVKFTINDKYVYARKYVQRNPARASTAVLSIISE